MVLIFRFSGFRPVCKQMKKFQPDVLGIMEWKLLRNKKGLKSYLNTKKNGAMNEFKIAA